MKPASPPTLLPRFLARLQILGPGLLVTAAFIGPGTVTTATTAGAKFGYALTWVVVFAIVATLVLQEMAVRLGLVARLGLGDAIRIVLRRPGTRWSAVVLIFTAIVFGNAAYQAGNLTGARLGMEAITGWSLSWPGPTVHNSPEMAPDASINLWPLVLGAIAFGVLWRGRYVLVERTLIALVVVMSGVFVVTAVLVQPDWYAIGAALVRPRVPDGAWLTVMALVGTTIVPYNLFLHASVAQEKWPATLPVSDSLPLARMDSLVSISIGGLVTMSILVTAASVLYGFAGELSGASMAQQLEPALGSTGARLLFAVGLTAAGLTSAITAPLAAAYAACGLLGWRRDLRSSRFRSVSMMVLFSGLVVAVFLTKSPAQAIVVAQIAGGIVLPLIAVFLLIVVNHTGLMRTYRNRWIGNVLGIAVIVLTCALGWIAIMKGIGAIK